MTEVRYVPTPEEWDAMDIDPIDQIEEDINAYFAYVRKSATTKPTTAFKVAAWEAARSDFGGLLSDLDGKPLYTGASAIKPKRGISLRKKISTIWRFIWRTALKAALPSDCLLVDKWELQSSLSTAFHYGEHVGAQRAIGDMSFEALLQAAEETKAQAAEVTMG